MESGILRWSDVTRTVRAASVRGLFGGNHRLSQLPDGSWSLAENTDAPDSGNGQARRLGDQLYLPHLLVGGAPIQIGGVPWTADPEPSLTLPAEISGSWVVLVGEISLVGDPADLIPPMSASLAIGSMPTSTETTLRIPLAIVFGRLVLSPVVRLEG